MRRSILMLVLGISASSGNWAVGQVTTSPPPQASEGTHAQPLPAGNHAYSRSGFVDGSHDRVIARWQQSLHTLSCVFMPARRATAPTYADVARLKSEYASPLEIVAARIHNDEVNSQNRIAAIRYLATRDCHYWHEAEEVLLAALRCDRNESVRFEAAKALAAGACSSQNSLNSLNLVVSGSDADGNPVEKSARVKTVAAQALQHNMAAQHPATAYLPPPSTTSAVPVSMPRALPAVGHPAALEQTEPRSMNDSAGHQALRQWAARAGTVPPRPRRGLFGLIQETRSRELPAPPSFPEPTPPPPFPESTPPPPLTPIAD